MSLHMGLLTTLQADQEYLPLMKEKSDTYEQERGATVYKVLTTKDHRLLVCGSRYFGIAVMSMEGVLDVYPAEGTVAEIWIVR